MSWAQMMEEQVATMPSNYDYRNGRFEKKVPVEHIKVYFKITPTADKLKVRIASIIQAIEDNKEVFHLEPSLDSLCLYNEIAEACGKPIIQNTKDKTYFDILVRYKMLLAEIQ